MPEMLFYSHFSIANAYIQLRRIANPAQRRNGGSPRRNLWRKYLRQDLAVTENVRNFAPAKRIGARTSARPPSSWNLSTTTPRTPPSTRYTAATTPRRWPNTRATSSSWPSATTGRRRSTIARLSDGVAGRTVPADLAKWGERSRSHNRTVRISTLQFCRQFHRSISA